MFIPHLLSFANLSFPTGDKAASSWKPHAHTKMTIFTAYLLTHNT
jgi:hypothetical protein